MTFDALDRLSYYVAPRLAEADGLCLARDFAVGALELGADAMQWNRGYWAKSLIAFSTVVNRRTMRRYRFIWASKFECPLRDANPIGILPGLPVRMNKREFDLFTQWRVGLYIARIGAIRAAFEQYTGSLTVDTREQLLDGVRTMPKEWSRAVFQMCDERLIWMKMRDSALEEHGRGKWEP